MYDVFINNQLNDPSSNPSGRGPYKTLTQTTLSVVQYLFMVKSQTVMWHCGGPTINRINLISTTLFLILEF